MVLSVKWTSTIALAGLLVGSWAESRDLQKSSNLNDGSFGGGVQKVIEEHRISLPAPTIRSTVIVSYPRITEGPSLVKRKLGSIHWDIIHNGIQGQKRDATSCPSDYNLCPQSMNGGCCPTDRVCGTSSCFPSSAAPASACGRSGYVACGIPEGGLYSAFISASFC